MRYSLRERLSPYSAAIFYTAKRQTTADRSIICAIGAIGLVMEWSYGQMTGSAPGPGPTILSCALMVERHASASRHTIWVLAS